MRYRTDWHVLLRASRPEGAQRLLSRLQEALHEELQVVAIEPCREQRGAWDCYFSTPDRDKPYAEAVVRCMRQAQALASEWKWGRINEEEDTFDGVFQARQDMSGTWLVGLTWASVDLVPAETPRASPKPARELTVPAQAHYTVWLEAERRAPGTVSSRDDSSDVIVTFENGVRWAATFYTYEHIGTLTAKNRGTGECLGGRYFWSSDMILIEELTRPAVEAVIADMLAEGTFPPAFQYLGATESVEPGTRP